jgi:hypothetical protein
MLVMKLRHLFIVWQQYLNNAPQILIDNLTAVWNFISGIYVGWQHGYD